MKVRVSIVLCGVISLSSMVAVASEQSTEAALAEYDRALSLTPDLERGKALYRKCSVCHDPEGWGRSSGIYPQIAGQLDSVVIKQLADIRAGNRGNPMMYPFTTGRVLRDAQDIADVSAYVAALKMTPGNGKGPRERYETGAALYEEYCADCHGEQGEGDRKKHVPLIQGQHYEYLVRQFHWISIGRRKNADKEMVEQIKSFSEDDMKDVLSYVSWLKPSRNKVAESVDYENPDFRKSYSRDKDDQFRSGTQKLGGNKAAD